MTDDNPYLTPKTIDLATKAADPSPESEASPTTIYTSDTVASRYAAALIDNALALALTLIAAKSIDDRYPALQAIFFLATYWLYFFISEGLTGRTIGKFLTGLVIVSIDGQRSNWRQALIRTLFRLLEVNPVILGGIPAGLCIVLSRRHQRMGDKVAGTIVARATRVRQRRKNYTPLPDSQI